MSSFCRYNLCYVDQNPVDGVLRSQIKKTKMTDRKIMTSDEDKMTAKEI